MFKEKIYETSIGLFRRIILQWLAIRAGFNGYRSFIRTFREHTGDSTGRGSKPHFWRIFLGACSLLLLAGVIATSVRRCSLSDSASNRPVESVERAIQLNSEIDSIASAGLDASRECATAAATADREIVKAKDILEDIMSNNRRCIFDGSLLIFPDLKIAYKLTPVEDVDYERY